MLHTVFPADKVTFQSKFDPLQSFSFAGPDLLRQLCSASANTLTASDAYADTLYKSPAWICFVYL